MKQFSHSEALCREAEIEASLLALKGKSPKSATDAAQARSLLDEFRQVHAHRLSLEHDAALDEVRSAGLSSAGLPNSGRAQIVEGEGVRGGQRFGAQIGSMGKYRDPWNTSEMRYGPGMGSELRSRALDCVERMPFADDKVREAATRFVERD